MVFEASLGYMNLCLRGKKKKEKNYQITNKDVVPSKINRY